MPERQRNDVEQQGVAAAGQRLGLQRRADRDHFVRIDVGERRAAEELLDLAAHQRHAGGAADQHHALDVLGGVTSASSSTWRQARMVRWTSGSIIASKALRVTG